MVTKLFLFSSLLLATSVHAAGIQCLASVKDKDSGTTKNVWHAADITKDASPKQGFVELVQRDGGIGLKVNQMLNFDPKAKTFAELVDYDGDLILSVAWIKDSVVRIDRATVHAVNDQAVYPTEFSVMGLAPLSLEVPEYSLTLTCAQIDPLVQH